MSVKVPLKADCQFKSLQFPQPQPLFFPHFVSSNLNCLAQCQQQSGRHLVQQSIFLDSGLWVIFIPFSRLKALFPGLSDSNSIQSLFIRLGALKLNEKKTRRATKGAFIVSISIGCACLNKVIANIHLKCGSSSCDRLRQQPSLTHHQNNTSSSSDCKNFPHPQQSTIVKRDGWRQKEVFPPHI